MVLDCNKKDFLKNMNFKLSILNKSKNIDQIRVLSKQYIILIKWIENIDKVLKNLIDLQELVKLSENDDSLIDEISTQLIKYETVFDQLEICLMFSEKHDIFNCYVDIQSGSGGIESQDWANMLLRMYLRWLDKKNFYTEIITESEGELSGIKSVTFKVTGPYAYGWLKTESGIHRLVRKNPFNSGSKRHTSFASVFIYPDIDENIDIHVRSEDLRVDVYKSSGSGGQHVNRTESAVRITHIPTNIVVQCQSDRSQHRNKNQAIKQLKAKLYNFELKKRKIAKKIRECEKQDITWGNQIRSYILDNSRIKDLRTGLEKYNVKEILNGDLDDFVKKSIKKLNKNYNV